VGSSWAAIGEGVHNSWEWEWGSSLNGNQSNGIPANTPRIVTAAFVLSALRFVCGIPGSPCALRRLTSATGEEYALQGPTSRVRADPVCESALTVTRRRRADGLQKARIGITDAESLSSTVDVSSSEPGCDHSNCGLLGESCVEVQ
jgi:hypothetical protein